MPASRIPVSAVYPCVQGEGWLAGTPMVLVRVVGCNARCPWCDTPEARQQPSDPLGWSRADEVLLVCNEVREEYPGIGWILLTGGEPTMYGPEVLDDLLQAAHGACWRVSIETNGTGALPETPFDWICVSPKLRHSPPLDPETLAVAHEVKWIVEDKRSVHELLVFAADRRVSWNQISVQPLWGEAKAVEVCYAACLRYGWRLSLQTHKYIGKP